ncbi:MAG: cyclic nucleotide-binding domain-containing protein [Anderseniella sp.]|nr:cyclic nucleotide-binding domain-containing protein [Anderseniella sp.]
MKQTCDALGASDIGELSDIMTHRTMSAGNIILHQGESSQLFAVIMSGVVKLTQILPDGREQIVGLLSAANSLGNPVSSVSNENAECVTDVKLCCFRRAPFAADRPELRRRSRSGPLRKAVPVSLPPADGGRASCDF